MLRFAKTKLIKFLIWKSLGSQKTSSALASGRLEIHSEDTFGRAVSKIGFQVL